MQARVWYAALFLSTAIALPVSAQTTGTIAFTNVNVVPMDTERILTRQTVIVVDGRVSLVGRSEQVSIPAGARTIEGGGGFLMPGLADLHVHVRPVASSMPARPDPDRARGWWARTREP